MPLVRAAPMMMSMPMMPMQMMPMMVQPTSARAVSYEEPRSRGTDRTCASSQDRLDELDERVESLHQRMKTIQRAVELQTAILEELKSRGSIGGQMVPKE